MLDNTCCLNPYTITSSELGETDGLFLTDPNKSRRIATFKHGATAETPFEDAVLLHEINDGDCNIRYWDCPSNLGRVYAFLLTACEVYITYFENGLLAADCNTRQYGSEKFCFGRIYNNGLISQSIRCTTQFEYDSYIFVVNGTETENIVFECGECSVDTTNIFSGLSVDSPGYDTLPISPPTPNENVQKDDDPVVVAVSDTASITAENTTSWNLTWNETLSDTRCNTSQVIDDTSISTNNPSIAVLPDGRSIIVYETRDEDGNQEIGVSIIHSSVDKTIVYFRSLSTGRLVNSIVATFEIFDNVIITTGDNGVPTSAIQIGFLTGPLKGLSPFEITEITRVQSDPGDAGPQFKNVINFNLGSRQLSFPDANDINNIKWFLCKGIDSDALETLTISQHIEDSTKIQIANPSIAVDRNNIMSGEDQIAYIAYQGFLDGQWNIYIRQIIISDNSDNAPTYKPPYVPAEPDLTQIVLSGSPQTQVVYRIKEIQENISSFCASFEVFLTDKRRVYNCDGSDNQTNYSSSCGLSGADSYAFVFISYSKTLCPSSIPSWAVGDEFVGAFPPTNVTFDVEDACLSIELIPGVAAWCFDDADCNQFYVFDDQVCTPIQTAIKYIPSDLYTLRLQDDSIVTRSVYNLQSFANDWSTLDIGVNDTVTDVVVYNDILVAGGLFTTAGGVSANRIAQWNGGSWSALGTGMNGNLLALTVYNGRLIAGGSFTTAGGISANHIAQWDGTSWSALGSGMDLNVNELTVYNGILIAGGNFTTAGGVAASSIAQWDGFSWSALGSGTNEDVFALTVYDEKLIVGGRFTTAGGVSANNIAQWDGSNWSILGSGVNDEVDSLTVYNGDLIAGGFFTIAGGVSVNNIAQWNGSNWAEIGDGVDGPTPDVYSLTVYNGILVAGGSFTTAGGVSANNIAQWNGNEWSAFGSGTNAQINIVSVYNEDLIAAGEITAIADVAVNYIARWTIRTISNVVERNTSGYTSDFLKPAEIYITYDGDLSDRWTNDADAFEFIDQIPTTGDTKGLNNFPFDIYSTSVYGIDPVHLQGNTSRWVYFDASGQLSLDYPDLGTISEDISDPILIDTYSTRPSISVNNRGHVIVAYENYSSGTQQIKIKGTGDFSQNSIAGPKRTRVTNLVTEDLFAYSHEITSDGLNQICDIAIDNNDVVHAVWQSSRDGYWEIYYANGSNLFVPVRLTEHESRSGFPKIELDELGNIYVVYHDNRFGSYQIFAAIKNEQRTLPLLEQDAYLSSYRSGFDHYTNILQLFAKNNTEEPGNVHIYVEFYDNKEFIGKPKIVADSRIDTAAFIIDADDNDPYVFDPHSGIYLEPGQSGIFYFHASLFRPGFTNRSYPYGFDTNQTYFPRIFEINPDGTVNENTSRSFSFSCNKCVRTYPNISNLSNCSYGFTFVNDDSGTNYYNFKIRFYSDSQEKDYIRVFRLSYGHSDLQLTRIDNLSAADRWESDGITILPEKSVFIEVFPDVDEEIVCGITYYIKVLYQKNDGIYTELEDINNEFFCECTSSIFKNTDLLLSTSPKWLSSAHGGTDIRLNETTHDTLKPSITTRSSGGAIVIFEEKDKLRSVILRISEETFIYGTGSMSHFDFEFNTIGGNAVVTTDMYDNIPITYEYKPEQISGDLPSSQIYYRVCNFRIDVEFPPSRLSENLSDSSDVPVSVDQDILIVEDPFLSSKIVKKIRIKDVDYFTYNASGQVTPVVSSCNIKIQLWGTPEVYAFRARNEGTVFSAWIPWSPEIGDFYTEFDWSLSENPGIKKICIQAMTYAGSTVEFCLPIVADYELPVFDIKLLKESNTLPLFASLQVASKSTITVEIVPNKQLLAANIFFDVLQQGTSDIIRKQTEGGIQTLSDGRMGYKGTFVVNEEDNTFNKDGLAKIIIRVPNECAPSTAPENVPTNLGSADALDSYNYFGHPTGTQSIDLGDPNIKIVNPLDPYRQSISGHVGTTITIRPDDDDPYFVFGNPDHYLEQN